MGGGWTGLATFKTAQTSTAADGQLPRSSITIFSDVESYQRQALESARNGLKLARERLTPAPLLGESPQPSLANQSVTKPAEIAPPPAPAIPPSDTPLAQARLEPNSTLVQFIRVARQQPGGEVWNDPEFLRAFVGRIQFHLERMRGAAPIDAIATVVQYIRYAPGNAEERAAHWVWDQLVALAETHDTAVTLGASRAGTSVERLSL